MKERIKRALLGAIDTAAAKLPEAHVAVVVAVDNGRHLGVHAGTTLPPAATAKMLRVAADQLDRDSAPAVAGTPPVH